MTQVEFIYAEAPPDARNDQGLLQEWANRMNTLLKAECPVNKNPNAPERGALRASLEVRVGGTADEPTASFYGLEYVEYVLGGTVPHIIRGKQGRGKGQTGVLAFQWHPELRERAPSSARSRRSGSRRTAGLLPTRILRNPFEGRSIEERFYFTQTRAAIQLSRGRAVHGGVQTGISYYKRASGEYVAGPRLVRSKKRPTYAPANVGGFNEETGERAEGRMVLAKVNHPGTKPNNFVARAFARGASITDRLEEDWGDNLENYFTRTVASAFKMWNRGGVTHTG